MSAKHQLIKWHCSWKLTKYDGDYTAEEIERLKPTPKEVVEGEGNLLVTNGANLIWKALTGTAITVFSNANAMLGVGDGNGSVPTPTAADTDLTATVNKVRIAMDATYPQISTNTTTFQSTAGTGVANFAWNEWGVFNAASGATSMLNHKGVALGTKTGGTWTLQVTLSLS